MAKWSWQRRRIFDALARIRIRKDTRKQARTAGILRFDCKSVHKASTKVLHCLPSRRQVLHEVQEDVLGDKLRQIVPDFLDNRLPQKGDVLSRAGRFAGGAQALLFRERLWRVDQDNRWKPSQRGSLCADWNATSSSTATKTTATATTSSKNKSD